MPEKQPVGRHSRGKGTKPERRAFTQWRTFAANIMAVRFQSSNRRATMCAIIMDGILVAGPCNLAYITGVFIGYIGTDSIGSLIKRFAAKKAG